MFKIFNRRKKPGRVYYVKLDKIHIQNSWGKTPPKPEKYERKKNYFLENGTFESTVYLNENNVLIDGYTTYLLAQEFGLGKIPAVYIVPGKIEGGGI